MTYHDVTIQLRCTDLGKDPYRVLINATHALECELDDYGVVVLSKSTTIEDGEE